MKVLIAGSSGLIGTALAGRLLDDGNEVLRLVRRAPVAADEVRWDPSGGSVDASSLEGIDAVVHLGGVSIAGRRWSEAYKQQIRDSRVISTRLLSETIANLQSRPAVFLCASALGYYGNRGDEVLTEESPRGSGFIANSTAEWESACSPASEAGIRVCNMRIGVVLSREGEMPRRTLLPFKLGLGGKLGNGRQYFSWVHIEDVVRAFVYALDNPSLTGPVNVSAPNPVSNAAFTRALARVLSRPAFFTVPEFALRITMGEMSQLALDSARVSPRRLEESGFKFEWNDIEQALRDVIG